MKAMKSAFAILVFIVVGCGPKPMTTPKTTAAPGVYLAATGDAVTPDEFRTALLAARVVLVGESHDRAEDHAVQVRILDEVAARKATGLGMEMFQRPFQPALDLFVTGAIDEAEMLDQTEWKQRWGFDPELYRPLWSLARDRGVPIVALNARRELTKRIAKVGVDGLADAERADLPELDLSDKRYRAWMGEIFRAHGAQMKPDALDRFFAAQVAWDETMADTAARWIETHPDATLVVEAGRGHIERDWGIPSRLRRRLGAQYGDGTVISVVPVARDAVPRWTWAQREKFADYVWVHE